MFETAIVRGVLAGAADLLEFEGWTRGQFVRDGRRCVTQAVRDAAAQMGEGFGVYWASMEALADRIDDEVSGVADWNDGLTSKAVLLATLRA